jgi:transposase-like protein
MYEDDEVWPLTCPRCLREFTVKISSLKTGARLQCPDCGRNFNFSTEEFRLSLAEAQSGRYDPWREMVKITRPALPSRLTAGLEKTPHRYIHGRGVLFTTLGRCCG